MLQESKDLCIKDKDLPNYSSNTLLTNFYCNDKYLMQQSKIFYLHEGDPLAEGLLDMEQLSKNQPADQEEADSEKILQYTRGPFMYKGSN